MLSPKYWLMLALYSVMLLINAAAGVALASHNPTLRNFVFSRGWDNLTSLFGGLGGLIWGIAVMAVLIVFSAWIVFDTDKRTWEKWLAFTALAIVFILVALFGRDALHGFTEFKAYLVPLFFAIVAAETAAVIWLSEKIMYAKLAG